MQEIIVYIIIGLTIFAVIRHEVKRWKRKGKNGCENCTGCPLKKDCSQSLAIKSPNDPASFKQPSEALE